MNIFDDIFKDWGKVFGKNKYPKYVDPSKIKREIKEENGGKLINETYSDPSSGIYWQSSSWTYGDAPELDKKSLEKQLKISIEAEEFEKACVIRDKIKKLR